MQENRTNLTKITLLKVFKHGTSMFVSALAVLGLFLIINYIIAVKTHHYDVTRNKINTLTDNTQTLLEEIDFPVSIKAFYVARAQPRVLLLLKEYQHYNDNITFELIDPLKNPLIAQEYEITEPSTIIFEAHGNRMRLKPPLPGNFHSEREITLMLYRVLTNESRTAYFLEGHGELSIRNPNQDGLSTVAQRLTEQGFFVESLNLATTEQISTEGTVIVIAEPKTQFSNQELERLVQFLDMGGSIMVLGAPGIETDLSTILGIHGLRFGDNFIYETSSGNTTEYGPTAPLCKPYDPSEIVEGLENQNIMFPMVRSVDLIEEIPNIDYTRLMASSRDSWAETDLSSAIEIRNGTGLKPSRNENEQRGPIVISYVTETRLSIPDSVNVGMVRRVASRSAFFGNARFAANTFIAQFPANLLLFQNTMNWISRNEHAIDITPHSMNYTPVELRRSQRKLIFWITVIIYPSIILLAGFAVWIRKR